MSLNGNNGKAPERPGISQEMLREAGVRVVSSEEALELIGFSSPGFVIPYRRDDGSPLTVNGKPFYRLRLTNPTEGAKYLSPSNSGCQLYRPPRLRGLLLPGCVIGITEGELKAAALVEAGFPCVGIGGISSACPRNEAGESELLPDLAKLIAEVRPARLAFIGDSDTALIPAFAREAVKLARLTGIPAILPRIALDAPGKGLDDLREVWGSGFSAEWQAIMANAVPVTADTNPADLAVRLLRKEAEAFGRLNTDALEKARSRLVKLGVGFRDDPLAFEEIVTFAANIAKVSKQTFRSAVRAESRQQLDSAATAREINSLRQLAELNAENPIYFDGRAYWRRESDGTFGQLCREDARLHLAVNGHSLRGSDGGPSPADRALHHLQTVARVNYAGPICGRTPGLCHENGLNILVTRGPAPIVSKSGECPTITRFLGNLFGRASGNSLATTQVTVFIAWLKLGRLAIRNPGEHRPGQVLAFVGPPDCGKSLCQSEIITPSLGGRVADPALWATGATTFNSDLWGAEHLSIGDKGLGEDGRERARLRDELKRMVAAPDFPLHAKHRDALTLRPVWRISLSANDDPESAACLPALDASFADKIIYLLCYTPPEPFFNEDQAGARANFIKSITDELPAFVAEVDAFEIPATLRKERFGVREFHHPKILDLIAGGSPLLPISECLEDWITKWEISTEEREVSSVELYGFLDKQLDYPLRSVSSGPSHLGRQLAGLAVLEGWRGRIIRGERRIGPRKKNQLQTIWRIRRESES